MFDFIALPGIGVDNTIKLFAQGCFACRVEDDAFVDRMFDFIALPGIGVDNTIKLFANDCFANRVMNDAFVDRMFDFAALPEIGVDNTIKLFANNCFANRVMNDAYVIRMFEFIDVCEDVGTIVSVYTSSNVTESFSISAENPVFVKHMMDFIKYARCMESNNGNLSNIIISVTFHLLQVLQLGDDTVKEYFDAIKSATDIIGWHEMTILILKCNRGADLALLQKKGFFQLYDKISFKTQIGSDEIDKVVEYFRNTAGSTIEKAMQSVHCLDLPHRTGKYVCVCTCTCIGDMQLM